MKNLAFSILGNTGQIVPISRPPHDLPLDLQRWAFRSLLRWKMIMLKTGASYNPPPPTPVGEKARSLPPLPPSPFLLRQHPGLPRLLARARRKVAEMIVDCVNIRALGCCPHLPVRIGQPACCPVTSREPDGQESGEQLTHTESRHLRIKQKEDYQGTLAAIGRPILLANRRTIIDQLVTDGGPTIERWGTDIRPMLKRFWIYGEPIVDRWGIDSRPTVPDVQSMRNRYLVDRWGTDSRSTGHQ